MAYMIIVELLIRQPKFILNDWYRLSLAALVVLVPIMLSLFTYNSARYNLPALPAALLLIVERLNLNIPADTKHPSSWFSIEKALAVVAFLALTMTLLATINYYIIAHLPLNLGDDPGLSDPGLLKVFPFFLILFVIFATFIVKRYWHQIDTKLYKSLAALHIIIGLGITIVALTFPSYQSQQIKHVLSQHVQADESIGGDWAPFFVADTRLKGLYMRPDFNGVENIEKLRPDYFLHSATPYDDKNFTKFKNLKTIKLGKAIELGTFAEHTISLYSIEYLEL